MNVTGKAEALEEIRECVLEIDRLCDTRPSATDEQICRLHSEIAPYKSRIDQLVRTYRITGYEIMNRIAPY